jgi:hypothetical protein
VSVTAALDDARAFKDALHLLVEDGESRAVALEATGTGSAVVCDELAAASGALDFGHQLAGRAWGREFAVRNLGRRAVALSWSNGRAAELARAFARDAKGTGAAFCT